MANIIRSPFYVPKPADDQREWYRQSVEWSNSWLVQLLTNTKFYGKGGQVPTKLWRWDYNTAESVWHPGPLSSWPIRLLINTKQYGQGGQVTAKFWRWDQDLNSDTALWAWKCPPNKVLIAVAAPFRSGQWLYELNDASEWQWEAPRNRVLDAVLAAPFTAEVHRFNYDESASWQWQAPFNLVAQPTLTPRPSLWRFDYSDPSAWSWQPPRAPFIPLLTAGGQPPTKRWSYGDNDLANWQPFTVRNRNLLDVEVSTPFVVGQQRYDYDIGETFWAWQAPIWLANYAGPPALPVVTSHPGWPGRRRWEDIDDEIERQRPLTRTQWNKLKAAQKAAEEKAAELDRQNKHRQAEELARIAREAGQALLDAEAARVEDAVSLTALTTALNAAANAARITTQLRTADRRLEAFKAYLADIEDEDETILLLSL